MSAEIVQLRDGPTLTDIAGQLRALADRIEAGDHGEVDALFAFMPIAGDYPRLWGWGDISGANDPLIQLELLKHWLLTNLVARA